MLLVNKFYFLFQILHFYPGIQPQDTETWKQPDTEIGRIQGYKSLDPGIRPNLVSGRFGIRPINMDWYRSLSVY